MQEDKPPVFDAFDTVDASLEVLSGALEGARFHAEAMRTALREGFVDATEVADYLAARGVPFREAHHVSGRLVAHASRAGKTLAELSLDELRAEHAAFEQDVYEALDPETIVERRDVLGGPARAQVEHALGELAERLRTRGMEVDA